MQKKYFKQNIFTTSCTRTIPVLLTLLILVAQCVPNIRAEDYGDTDNTQISSETDQAANNDDIYDAVRLQQEVESTERKHRLEMMDAESQTEETLQNAQITSNQISKENNSLENDNITEEDNGREEASESKEYDENASINLTTIAAASRTNLAETKSATTLVPEYIRKGKAKGLPIGKTNLHSDDGEETSSNVSGSEYMDDDGHAYSEEQLRTTDSQYEHKLNSSGSLNKETDVTIPMIMKVYHNKKEKGITNGNNQLEAQNPLLISQHQQLPNEEQGIPFNKHHHLSEEEYYTDSEEDDSEQNNSGQVSVTTPHHTGKILTPTPVTSTYQPSIAVARAGFAGFPTSFSTNKYNDHKNNAWNTEASTSTYGQSTPTSTTTGPFIIADTPSSIQSRAYNSIRIDSPSSITSTSTTPPSIGIPTTDKPLIPPLTATTSTTTTETPVGPILPTRHLVHMGTRLPGITEYGAIAEHAAWTPTNVAPTTTTSRPAGKQGKQINISRRKLLPHEQLRNYIEDAYIRMPLAVIVDPSAESLEKTKTLWRDALRMNLNIKIVLVSLNASGIPAAYNFNNTRQFLAGLTSIKEHDGGNAFIGIVHASELVPYDSAVFISTAVVPQQIDLVQDAAITLLKKRIRLYVIWYGERAITENETQEAVGGILGEVAIRSGGEILHIVGSESSQELEGSNTLTLVADAFIGSQEIDVPVDTTLSSLHVKIDAPMHLATLETPNGDINLKKLVKFKSRVFAITNDDKRLDAYVPLLKIRKSTIFKLRMIPEYMEHEYRVFVRGERKPDLFLDDMIRRFDTYFLEGNSYYPTKLLFRHSRLQSITAALAAATMPTHDNLQFPRDEKIESNEIVQEGNMPKNEVETFSDVEIHKPTSSNSTIIMGNQRTVDVLQKGLTSIEMGIHSQILVAPGMMAQLYFEVTNTRTEAILHNIQVVDERRYLLRLAPQSIFLRPKETATVAVTVLVPSGTPQGTTDRITFTCHGGETASLSLNLRVITPVDAQDTTSPSITWTFGNRCDWVPAEAANCAEKIWTMDITAQDWETGMLRLQSTPVGLIHRNTYTVGSRDPVKVTYISTCCEPKVSLTAYDIAGNQRTHNVDVRNIVLTEAAIAAIVLGVLLLILLIALLIAAIVWCCRRRRVTLDLPTYRSHSTRSMD